ncbi:MAG: SH3 domain-containing protein [Clostridia bacterium]|nr:SH3 domain-containing protein [Clostridia bacterium]
MTRRILSIALIAMMLAMFIPAIAVADGEWTMYVYTDNGGTLNVRNEPMKGDNVVGTLNYGDAVSVRMTMANGWAAINWVHADNFVGYVQSRFLVNYKPAPKPSGGSSSKTPTDTTDAQKVLSQMNAEFSAAKKVSPYTVVARPSRASGWVNLRWAPSTEMERIATCPQGKELTVLAELKNWYQVQDPATGMIGFISSQYVTRK